MDDHFHQMKWSAEKSRWIATAQYRSLIGWEIKIAAAVINPFLKTITPRAVEILVKRGEDLRLVVIDALYVPINIKTYRMKDKKYHYEII